MKLYRYPELVECRFVTSIYVKTEAQLKADKARKKKAEVK